MPYEIINSGPVTPHRLYALIHLVSRLEKVSRSDLMNYVQPPDLGWENQNTAEEVINAAIRCKLVSETGSHKTIQWNTNIPPLENFEEYRCWMQDLLLGNTKETEPNFLLNIFSAWYIVQDERVFDYSRGIVKHFNDDIFPEDTERSFNSTKLNSWETWASFLGFGWFNRENSLLIPDAHDRINPKLDELFVKSKQELTLGDFIRRLSTKCPELDGGVLFNRCFQISRQAQSSRNQLSLALSTALRVLNEEKRIKLIKRADSSENWQLYPASGYELDRVTHIRIGAKQK